MANDSAANATLISSLPYNTTQSTAGNGNDNEVEILTGRPGLNAAWYRVNPTRSAQIVLSANYAFYASVVVGDLPATSNPGLLSVFAANPSVARVWVANTNFCWQPYYGENVDIIVFTTDGLGHVFAAEISGGYPTGPTEPDWATAVAGGIGTAASDLNYDWYYIGNAAEGTWGVPQTWAAASPAPQFAYPTTPNGHMYAWYPGYGPNTGASEPDWTIDGSYVQDGDGYWLDLGPYRWGLRTTVSSALVMGVHTVTIPRMVAPSGKSTFILTEAQVAGGGNLEITVTSQADILTDLAVIGFNYDGFTPDPEPTAYFWDTNGTVLAALQLPNGQNIAGAAASKVDNRIYVHDDDEFFYILDKTGSLLRFINLEAVFDGAEGLCLYVPLAGKVWIAVDADTVDIWQFNKNGDYQQVIATALTEAAYVMVERSGIIYYWSDDTEPKVYRHRISDDTELASWQPVPAGMATSGNLYGLALPYDGDKFTASTDGLGGVSQDGIVQFNPSGTVSPTYAKGFALWGVAVANDIIWISDPDDLNKLYKFNATNGALITSFNIVANSAFGLMAPFDGSTPGTPGSGIYRLERGERHDTIYTNVDDPENPETEEVAIPRPFAQLGLVADEE